MKFLQRAAAAAGDGAERGGKGRERPPEGQTPQGRFALTCLCLLQRVSVTVRGISAARFTAAHGLSSPGQAG